MNETSIMPQFSLDNKVFVITGASSGIGRAVSGFLADAGASVVMLARREPELSAACSEITDRGRKASYVVADLGEREELEHIALQCRVPFGPVSGIVNAAGVNLRQPAEEVSLESWDQTLNLNLAVPFFFSRAFVQDMKDHQYGRIINIASLQSSRAFPNGLPYGSSKSGVSQLTRAMAETWSKHGITSNAIAPGFFPTELTAPVFSDPETERWAAGQTAIGRNGKLEDLRGVVVFFASDASSYITGQTLYVDGGFTAK